MISDLEAFRLFVQVYYELNFSRVAERLEVTPSGVSKRIGALEKKLGGHLFNRTTRTIIPTDAAHQLLPIAQKVLEQVELAESIFVPQNNPASLEGTVRISTPDSFGVNVLAHFLSEFSTHYPKIKIEVSFSNRIINLVEEGVDLCVRFYTTKDELLIARRVFPNRLIFVASPHYLKKSKPLKKISDLAKHPIFYLKNHSNTLFEKSNKTINDVLGEPYVKSYSGLYLNKLCTLGLGIGIRSFWAVQHELENKLLQEIILEDRLNPAGSAYIIYPKLPYLPLKTRYVIDFFYKKLKAMDGG